MSESSIPCECINKVVIGYRYNIYADGKTVTYRVIGCKKCKNINVTQMTAHVFISLEKQNIFLDELKQKGFLNAEDMELRIDEFRYGSKLVEIENIFDDNI